MARDDASPSELLEKDDVNKEDSSSKRDRHKKSRRSKHRRTSREEEEEEESSESNDSGDERQHRGRKKRRRSRSRSRSSHRRSGRSSSEDSEEESEESSLSDSESESESERRRERRRRREKEERKRKEKDRERRRRRKKEKEEKKRKKDKMKKKKKEKNMGKTGAVTNSWGKYGIIREVDMWNKRPEFTAWLAEVKQVNLEALSTREEKQMFLAFMEDHNTATFPSKKYYDLDAFHRHQIEKEMKKGMKNIPVERTIFDDEEQRRIEMMKERERQKEAEVEALKRSMQSGMAQAMKEQTRLREEMMYQYRLGNFEAAAALQKRLDPDAPP